MAPHHIFGVSEENAGDARMRSNRLAIGQQLRSFLLEAGGDLLGWWKTQLARNHLLAEVALAHEERDYEDPVVCQPGDYVWDPRLLLPKAFLDSGEEAAAAKFGGVLTNGNAGFIAAGRAVPDQHEGCS